VVVAVQPFLIMLHSATRHQRIPFVGTHGIWCPIIRYRSDRSPVSVSFLGATMWPGTCRPHTGQHFLTGMLKRLSWVSSLKVRESATAMSSSFLRMLRGVSYLRGSCSTFTLPYLNILSNLCKQMHFTI
jgi:hypothetical protein